MSDLLIKESRSTVGMSHDITKPINIIWWKTKLHLEIGMEYIICAAIFIQFYMIELT